MYRNAYTVPAAPTCIVAGCDREASFDGESRGYFQKCDECACVGVEHCTARACLVGGHTWLASEVRRTPEGYVFTCPSCAFTGDRNVWAARAGRIGGEADLANTAMSWLVQTRREVQMKALRDAFTPKRRTQWGEASLASLVYARAYLRATEPVA